MVIFRVFLLLVVFVYAAQAQNQKVLDSLYNAYKTTQIDTNKILILNELALIYGRNKPDSSINIAKRTLITSQRINFGKGIALSLHRIGGGYFYQNKFEEALYYYQQASAEYKKIGNQKGYAAILNNLATIYQQQGDYNKAVEFYQKSVEIRQSMQDWRGSVTVLNNLGALAIRQSDYSKALRYAQASLEIASAHGIKQQMIISLSNMGLIYEDQGNHTKALDCHFRALQIAEELDDAKGISNNLNAIGNIYYTQREYPKALEYYEKALKWLAKTDDTQRQAIILSNLGNIYFEQNDYTKAAEHYRHGLAIYRTMGDQNGIAHALNGLGEVYLKQQDDAKALQHFEESLTIREKLGDKIGMSSTLRNIARAFQHKQDYKQSNAFAQRGYRLAREIKAPSEAKNAAFVLYENHKQQGDFVKALEYHELYKQAYDTLFQVDKSKALATLEAKATLAEKEKEISDLNHNQAMLKKDSELQRIEIERQKNARLALEKEAEAERLLALAQNERNKHKQDSLFALAQKNRLEAEKHKAQQLKLEAESQARKLALQKKDLELARQQDANRLQILISLFAITGLMGASITAYTVFRGKQREQRAKEAIAEQKEEIAQINEELTTTLHVVEEERQKSDKLLLNILPAETAQELKEKGYATPKHYSLITVLFTDFKGFTNIAEKITPHEVIENLNTCFLAFDHICDKFGLEKIKTIGDAYMCAGGLPVANTTNPIDVVLAGIEMQAWMANWKREKEARGEPAWELRLGVHSGEAVAGVVGKNKFAYDIWGDTVNLASRMESSGEVGKVNISGTTYELVKHRFVCVHRGAVKAKNKGDVDMYFVEGEI